MESQLPSDPELMHCVLASPLVQNALCTSSPQLTGQRSLSNPQIQQLLTTNPEVEDMLNNPDAIEQVSVCLRCSFFFFASCLSDISIIVPFTFKLK